VGVRDSKCDACGERIVTGFEVSKLDSPEASLLLCRKCLNEYISLKEKVEA